VTSNALRRPRKKLKSEATVHLDIQYCTVNIVFQYKLGYDYIYEIVKIARRANQDI